MVYYRPMATRIDELKKYRDATASRIQAHLRPGDEIDQRVVERVRLPGVIIVGKSELQLRHFLLRPRDLTPVGGVSHAGKSSTVDFLDLSIGEISLDSQSNKVIASLVVGETKRPEEFQNNDRLYTATIPELLEAGFRTYYSPTGNNPLHATIVFREHIGKLVEVVSGLEELPEVYAIALWELLRRWKKVDIQTEVAMALKRQRL